MGFDSAAWPRRTRYFFFLRAERERAEAAEEETNREDEDASVWRPFASPPSASLSSLSSSSDGSAGSAADDAAAFAASIDGVDTPGMMITGSSDTSSCFVTSRTPQSRFYQSGAHTQTETSTQKAWARRSISMTDISGIIDRINVASSERGRFVRSVLDEVVSEHVAAVAVHLRRVVRRCRIRYWLLSLSAGVCVCVSAWCLTHHLDVRLRVIFNILNIHMVGTRTSDILERKQGRRVVGDGR